MPLGRRVLPFNHPDWLFEIKWDGFRSRVRLEISIEGIGKLRNPVADQI